MDLAAFTALSTRPWMAANWLFAGGMVLVAGGFASLSLLHVAGPMFWLSVPFLGLAMLEDSA